MPEAGIPLTALVGLTQGAHASCQYVISNDKLGATLIELSAFIKYCVWPAMQLVQHALSRLRQQPKRLGLGEQQKLHRGLDLQQPARALWDYGRFIYQSLKLEFVSFKLLK